MPDKHGYVVVDPTSGEIFAEDNPDARFRTASVAKPLVAYDFADRFMAEKGLTEFDPAVVPDFFRRQLSSMLRSSDDGAVDAFWDEPADYPDVDPASMWPNNGNRQVIARAATRMGLENTEPPPADLYGFWGFALTTPADVAKMYQHLLNDERGIGKFILAELGQATRIATDGVDQFFGLPAAMRVPANAGTLPDGLAIKQGWSEVPDGRGRIAAQAERERADKQRREQLFDTVAHTTGLVPGPTPESPVIVAVLSAYPGVTVRPQGTSLHVATRRLNTLTRDVLKEAGLASVRRGAPTNGPAPGFGRRPGHPTRGGGAAPRTPDRHSVRGGR